MTSPVRSCVTASACAFGIFMLFRRRGVPDEVGVAVAGVLSPLVHDLQVSMQICSGHSRVPAQVVPSLLTAV